MEKEVQSNYTYMGRSLNDLSINDDSAAFSECNSDRSGEFSTASSQSRRLLVACATENSDDLIRQLVSGLEASSIEDQKQAAMEIRLLAKSKSDNRIARVGAIKPLISLISSSDLQLQEYGVTAILNLSHCDKNKELIAASALSRLAHQRRERTLHVPISSRLAHQPNQQIGVRREREKGVRYGFNPDKMGIIHILLLFYFRPLSSRHWATLTRWMILILRPQDASIDEPPKWLPSQNFIIDFDMPGCL